MRSFGNVFCIEIYEFHRRVFEIKIYRKTNEINKLQIFQKKESSELLLPQYFSAYCILVFPFKDNISKTHDHIHELENGLNC